MNTLDQWEMEAKERADWFISGSGNCSLGHERELIDDCDRILALIDLVRKKDEALKFFTQFDVTWNITHGLATEQKESIYEVPNKAKEALALTEELDATEKK